MDMTGAVESEQNEQRDEVLPIEPNSHDQVCTHRNFKKLFFQRSC